MGSRPSCVHEKSKLFKGIPALLLLLVLLTQAAAQSFQAYPVYRGNDLGLTYSRQSSLFRIWAPTADSAEIRFYANGLGGTPTLIRSMQPAESGTWLIRVQGNLAGQFYSFRVKIKGHWSNEVPDPYAKAVGANGRRAEVMDLAATNPPGWEKDHSPAFLNPTDAIVYELQIRDYSIDSSSGIRHKGLYLGLAEQGTHNAAGWSTGLSHLKELGVTHVHLMPCFDFYSVDETKPLAGQYSWGYDPLNYNAPEGSFSTDPYKGNIRIREFKEMVQALHRAGLRVVMDVVYNHTMLTENSWFNELVPGYYYRHRPDGSFSNATACGNETASERPMMRKFMLESLKYWVKEYHIDGFRFDLMGVHDIQTMNLISGELHKMKPGILLYGEGWTAGESPLPDSLRALKANAARLDRIAVFSDDLRDAIKGTVFDSRARGFASGEPGLEESVKFGVVASCPHPQIDYSRVNDSKAPYAAGPWNTVSYASCHDNHTLWDKLSLSCPQASESEKTEMQKLALSMVLSSQGIAFLHAGSEFLRSKKGNENSYNAGDSINAIDWNLKTIHHDVFSYVQTLIRMRKAHPAFRLRTAEEVRKAIHFTDQQPPLLLSYTIDGTVAADTWKKILVVFNGSAEVRQLPLSQGRWKMFIAGNKPRQGKPAEGPLLQLAPFSCSILYQD